MLKLCLAVLGIQVGGQIGQMNSSCGLLTALHRHQSQVDLAGGNLDLQLLRRQVAEVIPA